MSEITDAAKVHEAYAFACMRCGYGWEQSYEIEHHTDNRGKEFVVYTADGKRVPSPLSSPTCLNCGGHVVRIMRAGQVSSVLGLMAQSTSHGRHRRKSGDHGPERTGRAADGGDGDPGGSTRADETPAEPHHWHLSDLLRPFHHRK
ncbi:hypothetical protein [Streptomyces zhihengii]|uniref:C2H2-type domain-containing protein n=1 Tax=Streptomyces zhihengii TaxID=1818004 RepID=A0ABS2UUW6_9ACTN|nr:hypothetical protein [Streptomyces zhihengii]MBM9621104.1 hypothetical protein [Streptomyces zhihengii]